MCLTIKSKPTIFQRIKYFFTREKEFGYKLLAVYKDTNYHVISPYYHYEYYHGLNFPDSKDKCIIQYNQITRGALHIYKGDTISYEKQLRCLENINLCIIHNSNKCEIVYVVVKVDYYLQDVIAYSDNEIAVKKLYLSYDEYVSAIERYNKVMNENT